MHILAEPFHSYSCGTKNSQILGYTNSCGTNMFVSIIVAICDEIQRQIDGMKGKGPLAVLAIILSILWSCIRNLVQIFTRYLLICHTFQSGSISAVAGRTWEILQKNLGRY